MNVYDEAATAVEIFEKEEIEMLSSSTEEKDEISWIKSDVVDCIILYLFDVVN